MTTITHRTPGFTGTEVIATRAYDFVDGVCEAELTPANRVQVRARRHKLAETAPPVARLRPSRRQAPEVPDEIGANVPVTEERPEEIA